MSAFIALTYDDRIELLTDGAFYTPDGVLADIRRKVWVADNLPIAFTGRGGAAVSAFAFTFRLAAGACNTVDDALEMIAGLISKRAAKGVPSDVEMVICCISESRGPSIFYFATSDIWGASIEPWVLINAGAELFGGTPVDVSDLDGSSGLKDCGAEIFDRMRRVPGPNPLHPEMPDLYGIGGHVDLTVVRADGVRTERLHAWPEDLVGKRIEPLVA